MQSSHHQWQRIVWMLIIASQASTAFNLFGKKSPNEAPKIKPKLLVVVIDGFRWDYLGRFSFRSNAPFPAFEEFLRTGVHTEYLKSVFPSENYPAWQTINTGLYPEHHDIVAKQFYDRSLSGDRLRPGSNSFFDYRTENGTGNIDMWNNTGKPIWASATEMGMKFVTKLWGRCDLPWFGNGMVMSASCETVYQRDGSKTLSTNIRFAFVQFQLHNFDAAIVYEYSLGATAEKYGPLSIQVEENLRELDLELLSAMKQLKDANMENLINIIILSDHGMAYGTDPVMRYHPPGFPAHKFQVKTVNVEETLGPMANRVKMMVGSGAYVMIYLMDERYREGLASHLRQHLQGKGVSIFTQNEIPDELHWKLSRRSPDILALAHRGTVIERGSGMLQKPDDKKWHYGSQHQNNHNSHNPRGISGYDPDDKDMRGVFMAKGPDFIQAVEPQPAIELVDVYQIMCHLLGIDPEPNDGVWERIKGLFRNSSQLLKASPRTIIMSLMASFLFYRPIFYQNRL